MKIISNKYELQGLQNKDKSMYIKVDINTIKIFRIGNFETPMVEFEYCLSCFDILKKLDFEVDKLHINSYDDLYKLNNISNYEVFNNYHIKIDRVECNNINSKDIYLILSIVDNDGRIIPLIDRIYRDSETLKTLPDLLAKYNFDMIALDINILPIIDNHIDYIPKWDHYFMSIAELTALRSKDINTKVGSVIVDNENKIKSIGYNGFPTGIDESKIPKGREGNPIDTKYPYVVHSEANALLNGNNDYKDCTIYTTLFPCNECAKLICQSGIKRVIYLSDKYKDSDMNKVAKMLFDYSGVSYFYIGDSYKGLKDIVNNLL